MDQLRKARSVAKGIVTRKANKLNELLTAGENTDAIKEIANDLDAVSEQFQNAHEAYHQLLKDEQALTESTVYFNTVNELVSELRVKTEGWLKQPVSSPPGGLNQVQPHDSASTIGSQRSSSIRSSSSAKAKAAAKQAALEAKADALKRMHELQFEELKIQQMKSQVELQGEIAAAEAEKLVFEQCEADEIRSNQQEIIPPSVHTQPITKQSVANMVPANHPVSSKFPESQPKQIQKETPLGQHLNSSVPEWFPSQPPLTPQYNGQTYDYPLQRLMETHDRQNIALQQIVQQQQQSVMALTLPQPTIKTFKGDPIEYCDFIRSFEHLVEEKTTSPSARLYYLIQYTSGPAQDLMKSCLSMNPEQG